MTALCLQRTTASRNLQIRDIVHSLGNIRPEGIHFVSRNEASIMGLGQGTYFLVSELLYGGVKAVNLATGATIQVVEGDDIFVRLGIDVDFGSGYILVLGSGYEDGGADAVRIFDAATGNFVVSCIAPSDGPHLNLDMEVVGTTVFVTDAFDNTLWTIDLSQISPDSCEMVGISLPAQWFKPPSGETSFMGVGEWQFRR